MTYDEMLSDIDRKIESETKQSIIDSLMRIRESIVKVKEFQLQEAAEIPIKVAEKMKKLGY